MDRVPGHARDRLAHLRAQLVETHRRLAYDRPPFLSSWRRRLVLLRHRHATVVFEGPVRIGPGFSLHMPGSGELRIGAGVEFRRDCRIEMEHNARVVIGARTRFTYGVIIQCTKEVTIGSGCLFANGSSVVDSKHPFRERDRPLTDQFLEVKELHIGDDVWVASKATIAADVGDHAVVAAHAVVTQPVPAWTLVGGLPARQIEYFGP